MSGDDKEQTLEEREAALAAREAELEKREAAANRKKPENSPKDKKPRAEKPKAEKPKAEKPNAEKPKAEKPKRQLPKVSASSVSWKWIGAPVGSFLVLVVLILSVGKPSADSLMKEAAGSFSEVSRGVFKFSITVSPSAATAGTTTDASPSTISLAGPFEIVPGKPLPRARITYTVSSGGRSQTVTLLTTGDKAYSVIRGQAYELPSTATKELKDATKDISKSGSGKGLSGIKLNFDKWLINPEVSVGPTLNGTSTWRTTAGVNVVEAVRDLVASSGTLGAVTGNQVPELKDSDVDQIKKSIKSASVVVDVGRYDRILRVMDLTMNFATPEGASAATGGIAGGKMNMIVGIEKPNQPVDVKPPKNPLPYKALQSLAESQSAQTGTALDDGVGK